MQRVKVSGHLYWPYNNDNYRLVMVDWRLQKPSYLFLFNSLHIIIVIESPSISDTNAGVGGLINRCLLVKKKKTYRRKIKWAIIDGDNSMFFNPFATGYTLWSIISTW